MGLHPLTWKVAKNAIRPLQGAGKVKYYFKNKTVGCYCSAQKSTERLIAARPISGALGPRELCGVVSWQPGNLLNISFPGLHGATAVLKGRNGSTFYELSFGGQGQEKRSCLLDALEDQLSCMENGRLTCVKHKNVPVSYQPGTGA